MEAVGKNHMPVTISPVKIMRPGDPGFPDTAGHYVGNEPEESARMERTSKACAHPGCTTRLKPARGNQIYCDEHRSGYWSSWRYGQQQKTGVPPTKGQLTARPKKAKVRPCQKPGCTKAKEAGRGKWYCIDHQSQRTSPEPTNVTSTPVRKAASVVAKSIANLKAKQSGRAPSAFDTQVGGDHYKSMVIQPVEFIAKNALGFCEGNVIKYVCRYHIKGGPEDIDKAIHYLQLLRETRYGKTG
jgi:hypothetical protein